MNSNEISFPAPAHWIDGQAVPFDGPAIEVVNPATGAVIASVPDGTAADVDRAVTAATAAFPAWAATDPAERAAVVWRIAAGLKARGEEIAATISAEMGVPISFARMAQAGLPVMATEAIAGVAADFP
jgi:aldehyde dehydrogenase (NAD+)